MPMLGDKEWDGVPQPKLRKGQEVWACRFTGEIFKRYEDYAATMWRYRQRVWTCEFTQKRNLTFEQALESELGASKWIDDFPQQYFAPLLARVQHSTKNIDALTTDVANHFSDHFVPGQDLEALDGNSVAKVRIVREIRSEADEDDDGGGGGGGGGGGEEDELGGAGPSGPQSQYEVVWLEQPGRTDLLPSEAIMRPKVPVASKLLIRNTIRAVSSKVNYPGGPWVVRRSIAEEYGVTTTMPESLKREHDEWVKRMEAAKRRKRDGETAEERRAREKEERMKRQEAERLRKIEADRWPMEDTLLSSEGVAVAPLVLPSSLALHLRTDAPNFGKMAHVWLALNTFSRWWNLFPFTLEDFDQALSGGDCTLMREVYVTLLRTVVSQEREDALREQGRHRAKENDLGEFGASIVGGSEWLMHTDVSTLDARDDDWEDMLRQYLDLLAQHALEKRLAFSNSREAVALQRAHQPWLDMPVEWQLGVDNKHHVVYDPGFEYPGGNDDNDDKEQPAAAAAGGDDDDGDESSSAAPMQTDAAAEAPPPALEKGEGGFFFPKTEPAPAAAESSVDEGPRYTQAELQSLLHSIVTQAKESYQGERSRAELFLELPSREDYPDYYETVQEPISIGMIEGKVAREEYTTPEHFREDWAQLRENAYAYNDDGSLVRVDAEHFFNLVHAKLLQFEALHQLSTESEHAQTARALQVPDISQIPRGTIARGEEPLETRLEVLCFLVEEALTCDPTRKQLDNILEEQTDVRNQLRAEQIARNIREKELREKQKQEEAAAGDEDAAAAAALGIEEPAPPPDPLAELRASVDAMAAVNTAGMSRQELVAHNKNLKDSSELLRREEIAIETKERKRQLKERQKELDQRKKMEGFYKQLEELQVRSRALGFDRQRNRYWLLRAKEPATADDSMLFIELAPPPAAEGADEATAAPPEARWVQIVTEEELNALIACLNVKGVREQGLRKELLRHSATIAPGLARLKKRVGPTAGEGRVSGRNQEKAMTRYLNYRNRWWSKGKAVD